jgi:hypothetical protein
VFWLRIPLLPHTCDLLIMKKILHLPASVATGFIYARKWDGVWGCIDYPIRSSSHIWELGWLWLMILTHKLRKLQGQTDYFQMRMNNIAHTVGASWPLTYSEVSKHKLTLKINKFDSWAECSFQGRGIEEFVNNPVSNNSLCYPSSLRPHQYIEALRLRTNTTGVQISLGKLGIGQDHLCLKCTQQPETQAHALGICTSTKDACIQRHDVVLWVKEKLPCRDLQSAIQGVWQNFYQ